MQKGLFFSCFTPFNKDFNHFSNHLHCYIFVTTINSPFGHFLRFCLLFHIFNFYFILYFYLCNMKTLSLKVAIGYIVIIALFIGTSYYIQQQASIFSSSNKLEDSIQSRRSSCDKLIELVLEAEALAQTSSIGDYSSYKKYLSTINRIDTAIILLDSISTDSSKLLLDSLANTIHYKALIVKNLYDISSKKSTNTYQKQIEDLIEQYSNTTNTTNTISTNQRTKSNNY